MAEPTTNTDNDSVGTSPEPHFNLKPQGMKPELLQEWLVVLAQKNAKSMQNATHKQVEKNKPHIQNSELRNNLFDPRHINSTIYSVVKLSRVKLSL